MVQIEALPCSLFTTAAHRAIEGMANQEDGSEQAILRFLEILRKWHKLGFDKEYSLSMVSFRLIIQFLVLYFFLKRMEVIFERTHKSYIASPSNAIKFCWFFPKFEKLLL
ncbi:hypothetical protein FSP39_004128 [Pinctada imbricata]|uniref:Uncharacterized protein n=1 Tax=Pinctada imbricata TaxID=66713 RepID=A0AA88YGR5_PINIB|nr:hypothetical protein FSP39_004128 [Pinctada imbricata]